MPTVVAACSTSFLFLSCNMERNLAHELSNFVNDILTNNFERHEDFCISLVLQKFSEVLYAATPDSELAQLIDSYTTQLVAIRDCSDESTPIATGTRIGQSEEKDRIQSLIRLNMTVPAIAENLGMSTRTLERRMADYGLSIRASYSSLSNEQLDELIRRRKETDPSCGTTRMLGYLRAEGYRVQRDRVRQRMKIVDGPGVLQRRLELRWIKRRGYHVPGPNSFWHIDGHHKLVRWKIVTHAGIDGFSRLVTYMNASANNLATTVLDLFREAVEKYGMPHKVRSDRGGENVLVADFVLELNGEHSFIAGRSVHNQRIERLWRDVHSDVTQRFYHFFYNMEEAANLDIEDDVHIAVLHFCFLPFLNRKLSQWAAGWNNHSIRTANHQTPLQMFYTAPRSERENNEADGVDWDPPLHWNVGADTHVVVDVDVLPQHIQDRIAMLHPSTFTTLDDCETNYSNILLAD